MKFKLGKKHSEDNKDVSFEICGLVIHSYKKPFRWDVHKLVL